MLEALNRFVERVLAPVPGWLLLIAGMALIAMAVLAPAWIEAQELEWQAGLMREQFKRLNEEEQNYQRFDQALAEDDPVVLEQLAFYHLRLKPAGADLLAPKSPAPPALSAAAIPGRSPGAAKGKPVAALTSNDRGRAAAPPRLAAPANASAAQAPAIEELLHTQMPRPGIDYPTYQRPQTRLMRIVGTMRGRLGLLSAGVLCLVAGLLMGTPGEGEKTKEAAAASVHATGAASSAASIEGESNEAEDV